MYQLLASHCYSVLYFKFCLECTRLQEKERKTEEKVEGLADLQGKDIKDWMIKAKDRELWRKITKRRA